MVVVLRQWKLQRERLQADFTKALDNFQRAQRSAAQKEKDAIKKYKNQGVRQQLQVAGHIENLCPSSVLETQHLKVPPPGEGGGANLIDIEGGQNKTQVISIYQQLRMNGDIGTLRHMIIVE